MEMSARMSKGGLYIYTLASLSSLQTRKTRGMILLLMPGVYSNKGVSVRSVTLPVQNQVSYSTYLGFLSSHKQGRKGVYTFLGRLGKREVSKQECQALRQHVAGPIPLPFPYDPSLLQESILLNLALQDSWWYDN